MAKYRVRPGDRFWGVEKTAEGKRVGAHVFGPGEVVDLTDGQIKNGFHLKMDEVVEAAPAPAPEKEEDE